MKQLEVQIMGQSYLLGCPEGGDAQMLEAVNLVDSAMCKIRDSGKVRARDRIAVLAALNLAFDLTNKDAPAQVSATASHSDAAAVPLSGGQQLDSLIHKLDLALGEDGRLF